jgi:hypothetical protein
MPDFTEDELAWPVMVRLVACLEETLLARGLPGVCRATVVPGPQAVIEACGGGNGCNGTCGGQAWVRFNGEFPYTSFPTQDTTAAICATQRAFTLEVGIARCLPVGSANAIGGFTPPTVQELVDATRLQMADKAAMALAIECCMDVANDQFGLDYVLGQYQPMQIAGDCGGGTWLVTIG